MKHVNIYNTKARWAVTLDKNGLPVVGYDRRVEHQGDRILSKGENVLIHGSLLLTGTSRGRSAAHFDLYAENEWTAHMTMSGTELLFHALADGRMTMEMGKMTRVRRAYDRSIYSQEDVRGPVFTGYWTIAKQGTQISLIPAPRELFP